MIFNFEIYFVFKAKIKREWDAGSPVLIMLQFKKLEVMASARNGLGNGQANQKISWLLSINSCPYKITG